MPVKARAHMNKEEYTVQVETTGDYKTKKQFRTNAQLSQRDFIKLCEVLADFLEDPSRELGV